MVIWALAYRPAGSQPHWSRRNLAKARSAGQCQSPGGIECQAGYRSARDTELCPLPRWRPPRPWVFLTT